MKNLFLSGFIFFSFLVFTECNFSGKNTGAPSWTVATLANGEHYGHWYFRNGFRIKKIPDSLIIGISADKRYRLYVNGQYLGTGPQLSDTEHWKYDTWDIGPYLKKGMNLIAAGVDYFGRYGGESMITVRPAFWFSCEKMPELNTPGNWQFREDHSRYPVPVEEGVDVRGGFLAPACDSVVDRLAIRGWNLPGKQTGEWIAASGDSFSIRPGEKIPWTLEKRNIPPLERDTTRFEAIRDIEGPMRNRGIDASRPAFPVPPHTRVRILFDNGILTAGFPELHYSGGAGSAIRVTWSESLYMPGNDKDGERLVKGNRDITSGKVIVGYHDVILADGQDAMIFIPSWFRTYRYAELDITTADDTLHIDDFFGMFTAYPFDETASFSSGDPELQTIWETSWRTARLCAWETYMDCPYYEQLQYIGDTRIQSLISLYVSGDDRLMRNALEQFSWSVDSSGLTNNAWPSRGRNVIPPFSLFWTLMVHDYYMLRDDSVFVSGFLDKIAGIMEWHRRYIDPVTGMLENVPYWNFVDWTQEWPWIPEKHTGGVPEGGVDGISSILSLQYAWSLKSASMLFAAFGRNEEAGEYMQLARKIIRGTFVNCWDDSKKLLADSPEKTEYSQHANIMAVITGLVPAYEAGKFMERIASDRDLIQATVYYRFFMNRALEIAGRGDLFLRLLDPWKEMLHLGLTTFAEKPEPTRSDCHGWSASPAYEFLALVCGIRPASPGFRTVLVRPAPGSLDHIEAQMPHPGGLIRFSYMHEEEYDIFHVALPENLSGTLVWNNREYALTGGGNEVKIEEE